ncbi:hypothetical protein CCR75_005520 [Bremia lactucae]|uniref:Secreted protein n=1 Tax=Bremia lactucae TaxID=4779 RepID=A0A976IC77_BRELC|nr:hypothetical protein CCR75_005520 [Bremia lactucae]
MFATVVKPSALVVTMLTIGTEAHNKLTIPLPTYADGFHNQNSPSGIIDAAKALPVPSGMSYGTDPASNTNAYWTAFNASTYKTLKDLAWASQTLEGSATKECGFSLIDGTPQDLPDEVQWDFFTGTHQGPCEVYCDDTLVFTNWNCAVDYPQTPANLPYDKAKCEGASVLSSYWIALHTTPWQVYTNCAPLKGGSASTTSTDSSSDYAPTITTAATPTATASTIDTYVTKTLDESSSTDTDTELETFSTESAIPTEKCLVRRRRH